MTCPSPLRRRQAGSEFVGDLPRGPLSRVQDGAAWALARMRGDDGPGQFARFVLVGGSSTALYAALYVGLGSLGYLTAHLIATVASSILANEMHRRLTFHAEGRVHWLTAQLEAGGVSVLGLLATSAALSWLNESTGSVPVLLQITLVGAVTALIGLMRFVALRWLFRGATPQRP